MTEQIAADDNDAQDTKRSAEPEKALKDPSVTMRLAVLLGFFGAHRFYLGDWKVGLFFLACLFSTFAVQSFPDHPLSDSPIKYAVFVLIMLVIIDIIRAEKLTERRNKRLREAEDNAKTGKDGH